VGGDPLTCPTPASHGQRPLSPETALTPSCRQASVRSASAIGSYATNTSQRPQPSDLLLSRNVNAANAFKLPSALVRIE
jgi:hypothetical protein